MMDRIALIILRGLSVPKHLSSILEQASKESSFDDDKVMSAFDALERLGIIQIDHETGMVSRQDVRVALNLVFEPISEVKLYFDVTGWCIGVGNDDQAAWLPEASDDYAFSQIYRLPQDYDPRLQREEELERELFSAGLGPIKGTRHEPGTPYGRDVKLYFNLDGKCLGGCANDWWLPDYQGDYYGSTLFFLPMRLDPLWKTRAEITSEGGTMY